nr:MAG TPA: hypothetical protein [Caudoviricetes sp.]
MRVFDIIGSTKISKIRRKVMKAIYADKLKNWI